MTSDEPEAMPEQPDETTFYRLYPHRVFDWSGTLDEAAELLHCPMLATLAATRSRSKGAMQHEHQDVPR